MAPPLTYAPRDDGHPDPGDWDSRGRASEVRTNRILQLDPSAIRREGGRITADVFDRVAAEVRRRN